MRLLPATSARKIRARRAKAKLATKPGKHRPAACPGARAPSFAQAIRLDRPIGPGAGGFCTRAQTAASPGAHFPNEKSKALTPAARSERGIPIARILDALSVGSPPSRGSKPLSPPPKKKSQERRTQNKNEEHKKKEQKQTRPRGASSRQSAAPPHSLRLLFFLAGGNSRPIGKPSSTQAA